MKRVSVLLLIIIVILLAFVDNNKPHTVVQTEIVRVEITSTPKATATQLVEEITVEPTIDPLESDPLPEVDYPFPIEVISKDNFKDIELLENFGDGYFLNYAVSPDGSLIAVYLSSGIKILDSLSLDEKFRFDFSWLSRHLSRNTKYYYGGLDFSPDGKYIAYSHDSFVYIEEIITGNLEKTLVMNNAEYYISEIEFSPLGKHVLITSRGFDRSCDGHGLSYILYTFQGDKLFENYYCSSPLENYYRFTLDNRLFVFHNNIFTTQQPWEFFEFDLSLNEYIERRIFPRENYELSLDPATNPFSDDFYYDISPDGKLLVSKNYENGEVISRILDARTGELLEIVEGMIEFKESTGNEISFEKRYQQNIYSLSECGILEDTYDKYSLIHDFGDKHLLLFENNWHKSLMVWGLEDCELLEKKTFPMVSDLEFSLNGQYLALSDGFDLTTFNNETMYIDQLFPGTSFTNENDVFAFSNDGELIFSGQYGYDNYSPERNRDYEIYVWDNLTGELITTVDTEGEFLKELSVNSEDTVLIVKDKSRIHLVNSGTFEIIGSIPSGVFSIDNEGGLIWVAEGPDKNYPKYIKAYSLDTGALVKTIYEPFDWVRDIQLVPNKDEMLIYAQQLDKDGKRFDEIVWINYSNSKIELESVIKQNQSLEFFHHIGFADRALIFSKGNSTVFLDLETLERMGTIPFGEGFVTPDGSLLVIIDDEIELWDMKSGDYLGDIQYIPNFIDLQISPDGKLLAVVGEDGLIYLYGVRADR